MHGHQSQLVGDTERGVVAHEALVEVVREQHPVLVFAHAEEIGFLVELDTVGLLVPVPGRIAPALDLDDAVVHGGRGLGVILDEHAACFVLFLRGDRLAVVGVDVQHGELAEPDLVLCLQLFAVIGSDGDPVFIILRL